MVAAGVLASGPLAWWLGDALDSVGGAVPTGDADYFWQPLSLSTGARAAVGLSGVAVVACALTVLVRQVRSGHWRAGWVQVTAASAMVCAYAGMFVAVATAPVIGANIGAGVMLLAAAPVGLGAVIWAIVALVRLRSPAPGRSTQPPTV